jgi:hypothetical protein
VVNISSRIMEAEKEEYTVKKVNDFSVPSWDVTTQTLSGQGELGK